MYRLLYLMLIPFFVFIFLNFDRAKKSINSSLSFTKASASGIASSRLKQHSSDLLNYAKKKAYNTDHAFLIDMKIPSGNNRFFVYDLQRDSILRSGLVAHGYGSSTSTINFSNVPGSNCSSLGKYRIGKPYHGRFGLAYKLYGLDSTNNNAINRFVVLHSHACVPDSEISPFSICRSQGCPTVSPSFLTQLKPYIDNSQKPVLLYIFY